MPHETAAISVHVLCTPYILTSQFLRLRHLCSDDTDFKDKAEKMVEFFIQRHYPEDIVRTALQKVKTLPCQQALQPNNKTATEKRKETNHQSVVPPTRYAKSSNPTGIFCNHMPNWQQSSVSHCWSQSNLTLTSVTCWCDLNCINQPQEY